MPILPAPPPVDDTEAIVAWVVEHLGHLTLEDSDGIRPGGHRGGQTAADIAIGTLDITGYARTRSNVLPEEKQGASRMSPYIRHGLLDLPQMWDAVGDAPAGDKRRYRDELLWQEYARHLYARLGPATAEPLRHEAPRVDADPDSTSQDQDGQMACMTWVRTELEENGWLVNQTRMWWASHWSVRHGRDWRDGDDYFFRHLLDGSRAANRLGWQWTVGTGSGKPYGFSRWQVEKRAPQLCRSCALSDACPIQEWPDADSGPRVGDSPVLAGRADGASGPGPDAPILDGAPSVVWLTAESLGDADPALDAHPDVPVVFVFDEPALDRMRLSGKRLIFVTECLADLAERRDLEIRLGGTADELTGRPLAVTFAPVPRFPHHVDALTVAALHPWPWLARPGEQKLTSYSAWRKGISC